MSRILRHAALAIGLQMSPAGYVPVDALMGVASIAKFGPTIDDIVRVWNTDKKYRFMCIRTKPGNSLIVQIMGTSSTSSGPRSWVPR